MGEPVTISAPPVAGALFGERLPLAVRYAELLADQGVVRGLIGPRELGRLWERHLLNSAALAELIAPDSAVLDVGSGAGFPGLPLAIARPDLRVSLLEPMARRTAWLTEVVADLALPVTVIRGRAEEPTTYSHIGGADVVTARAVAPLARLAQWCLPLVRPGGQLLALKGASVGDEIARDADAVRLAGGTPPRIGLCGKGVLRTPTTVAIIQRVDRSPGRRSRQAGRKDR